MIINLNNRVLSYIFIVAAGWGAYVIAACIPTGSDAIQQDRQEVILAEATAQVGMPSIKNFREKRLVKMLLEMRDQDNLSTTTYIWSEMQGRAVFFCNSIGYGIPYATQFTAPEKAVQVYAGGHYLTLPQADPNGLFSPATAEGTWVMCKDPKGTAVKPVFVEPRVIVTPFDLASTEAPPAPPPISSSAKPATSAAPAATDRLHDALK
jgi:hypothetical protein